MSSHSTATADDPRIGRVLVDRFRIIERIATGGMGIVYKAEQMPLGREVVIKILESKHLSDVDDTFRQRFFLEAAAAAKLHHPNTIVVYDYGHAEDGEYYIAMELVEGATLGRRLKDRGPLTPAQAVHVALQVCSSLRDAHEHGLVHRDLKPANVMFSPRAGDGFFVKVLDFGLVKVMGNEDEEAAAALTQNGLVMGSPRYMSPEQVRSLPIDRRTDIYSFGATLYHMVAGAPPFASGKQFDAMSAHVSATPPSLIATWAGCEAGPRLEALVMRCLEKDPDDRFQSMDEVMQELYACIEESGGGATSGAAYVSHVSLPGLKLAAEQGDSQPRLTGSHHSATWDTVPSNSGARRRNDSAGETLATASEISVAPPAPDRRWLIAGGVVMLAACSAVALWFVSDADPENAVTAPVAPAPTLASVDPVQIVSTPPGATVRRNGQDLGDTPLSVPVPRGESWQVEVALAGHDTRTVTLIGGQPHMTVNLAPRAEVEASDSDDASDEADSPPAARVRRWTPPRHRPPTAAPARPNAEPSADDEPARRPVDLHDPWQ